MPFHPREERVTQKAFVDHMWNISLTEMIDLLWEDEPRPKLNFDILAAYLNKGNRAHADEIRSFKQAYVNEISDVVSLFVGHAANILEDMFKCGIGIKPSPSIKNVENTSGSFNNFLLKLFVRRKSTLTY